MPKRRCVPGYSSSTPSIRGRGTVQPQPQATAIEAAERAHHTRLILAFSAAWELQGSLEKNEESSVLLNPSHYRTPSDLVRYQPLANDATCKGQAALP